MKYLYLLYDSRYRTDEDSAICLEVCDSLKEAKENAPDYGNDVVIVKYKESKIDKRQIERVKIMN